MTFQLKNYSKKSGAGVGRVFPTDSIANQPHAFDNHYVPGSGVGASTISNRAAKMRRASQPGANICFVYKHIKFAL